MNGVGCHILPISTPGITIYGGIWKTSYTETTPTQLWIERSNFNCCHQNHCTHTKQSSCQFSVSTTNSLGCWWFIYWTCAPLTNQNTVFARVQAALFWQEFTLQNWGAANSRNIKK
jgi:hypothetical protein